MKLLLSDGINHRKKLNYEYVEVNSLQIVVSCRSGDITVQADATE